MVELPSDHLSYDDYNAHFDPIIFGKVKCYFYLHIRFLPNQEEIPASLENWKNITTKLSTDTKIELLGKSDIIISQFLVWLVEDIIENTNNNNNNNSHCEPIGKM